VNSRVKEKVDKIKNHENIMKNRLLSAHQDRTLRKEVMPDLYLSQRELMDRNHQLDTYVD